MTGSHVLWYKHPAQSWNEALPVGNGRMGGMVYGRPAQERIQLNEDSVWYGDPIDRNNPDALQHLPRIRQMLLSGSIREAEELAALALSGVPESQRPYQSLGSLEIDFRFDAGTVTDYVRVLDLDRAESVVRFMAEGVRYERTLLVSAVDQVMALRMTADKPGSISFRACLRRGRYLDAVKAEGGDTIAMHVGCGTGPRGIRCCAKVRAVAEGGVVETVGEFLTVRDADAVTLLVVASTSFYHADFAAQCDAWLNKAVAKPFACLQADHRVEHAALFGRMSLSLSDEPLPAVVAMKSEGDPADDGMPPQMSSDDPTFPFDGPDTAERLAGFREGRCDPDLIATYFQYGRYLLIGSSRPGTQPANLQGIWNEHFLPPWDSKYTININTQMNYWPAETCNLSECHLPLFDLVERMREPGRHTARTMYGCRGFVAHHNTDIWGDTAPQDIWIPATYWPMGAAWLCLHLWEHYQFTLDNDFLERAYGTMKEAAEFFADFLEADPKGRLVTVPSVSPENTYILPSGEKGCLCAGPSMDSQILFALFSNCIEAAGLLGRDTAFAGELAALRDRLPAPQIGRHGQLQEWTEDYEEEEPGHRHISHLFGLHPGRQFTVRHSPELAEAAKTTLRRRLAHGGGHTGWSRAWIINLWARLKEGETAYENVCALLAKSTLDNLLDNHPPFQIDGNFGATAGIAEMLMQSHEGGIELLPALPEAWKAGHVAGLVARGGFEVEMMWREGRVRHATVFSRSGQPCTLLVRGAVSIDCDGVPVHPVLIEDGWRFATEQGKRYRVIPE